MQLILRLYESTEGNITYCGTNINDIKLDQYRKLFSQVEQKTFLFNSSIRENIDPSQSCSDEQILDVADFLGVLGFFDSLADGLDSNVGVDGSKLSGGERQKIAALRAWIKPHKVLILDEVTNNLDMESEHLFNEKIMDKCDNGIIFIITHRVEMLQKMDKILVMENGKLINQGTYAHLLGVCSVFSNMLKNPK